MPGRVLLVSTNRCVVPEPVFPLGLAHVQAVLRRAGHETAWHDALVGGDLEALVREFRPDWVGISLRNVDDVRIRTRETYHEPVAAVCALVRRVARCPVILGGSGFSVFPARLLEHTGADFGICGEGEEALVRLLDALERGGEVSAIPGLVYRAGAEIRVNPVVPVRGGACAALEAERPPAITAHYLQASGMLNLQTQRGCAHGCCYCTYPAIEGRWHRRRPAGEVAEEFARLAAAGARYVFVVDSIFNSSPAHVAETCEALIRRDTGVRWSCFLRPQGVTAELARLMARAGLVHTEFGSDSLCDTVLAAYRKRMSFADILAATEAVLGAGIECCHFLICGGPGETEATLAEGFANSLRLGDAVVLPCVGMRIYPGTWLYQLAVQEGRVAPGADLLTPAYYLAEGLDEARIGARLADFAARSPHWLVGTETAGDYRRMVARLRERGIVGPLWSYFSLLRRLAQPPAAILAPAGG